MYHFETQSATHDEVHSGDSEEEPSPPEEDAPDSSFPLARIEAAAVGELSSASCTVTNRHATRTQTRRRKNAAVIPGAKRIR